jgi:hypothetical protein
MKPGKHRISVAEWRQTATPFANHRTAIRPLMRSGMVVVSQARRAATFAIENRMFGPLGQEGDGAWGRQNLSGKRIPFAKFIDIVYIPWFHCTVGCRRKGSRGSSKPIHVM